MSLVGPAFSLSLSRCDSGSLRERSHSIKQSWGGGSALCWGLLGAGYKDSLQKHALLGSHTVHDLLEDPIWFVHESLNT